MSNDPTSLAVLNSDEWASEETANRCLEQCLTQLTWGARRLIISYYETEKAARIERHQRLADEFGKSVNALRIEVHRTRKLLRQCVAACLSPAGGAEPAFSFGLKTQRERGGR
jgi:DNA-directed RNA polymerase specialized sigma24 family protein